MSGLKNFLQRKDIVFSAKRYGIDALSAMAQGLFASLLIGTILSTLGQQMGVPVLEQIGGFASSVKGAAMAIAIGYALHCPPLVLFSLAAVGFFAQKNASAEAFSLGLFCVFRRGNAKVFFVLTIEGCVVYITAIFRRLHRGNPFVYQRLRVDNFLAIDVLRGTNSKPFFEGVRNPRFAYAKPPCKVRNRQRQGEIFVNVQEDFV